ncbi:uncharacterized protein LOC121298605 [Polyodon spathula]|uniref:uncharacterized protein LOC121298605 n=1 Tax=Polyodon spathula TaxID=7913 RepID=UPI001B7DF642|nr:uncharacterized protein LOC121298605 [Polyodon spathula]
MVKKFEVAEERRVVIGDNFTFSLHSNKSNLQVEFRSKSEENAQLWTVINNTVRWDGEERERRALVRDKVFQLSSVTKQDEGSYTVWEKRSSSAVKNIRLSVEGRKENVTLSNGETKKIPLYRKNATVWFKPRGAVNSSVIVGSAAGLEDRVSVQDGVLTLRKVTKEEEGTYTVLDSKDEVRAITVTVEDSVETERNWHVGLITFAALGFVIAAAFLMWKWIYKTQNEEHVEMLQAAANGPCEYVCIGP